MGKVVTFGEIMLRLAPQGFLRFSQANSFDVVYGGGESNVAVSLANYLGCDKFSAHVQQQNVKLFERLQWNVVREIDSYGIKHFLMEADLNAYPPTPIYQTPYSNKFTDLLKTA